MASSKQSKSGLSKRTRVPWEIKPKNLYLIHGGKHKEGLQPGGDLLAECTAAGRLAGNFRWAMKDGNANAGFRLLFLMNFGSTPQFYLSLDMKPNEIQIRPNTCSGKWTDLIDWIAEDKLTVTCNDGATREDLLGKGSSIFQSMSPIMPISFLEPSQNLILHSTNQVLHVDFDAKCLFMLSMTPTFDT